jgi:hypothetical protein
MKRLLALIAFFALSSMPSFGTWNRVTSTSAYCDGPNNATCSVAFTPTTVGDVLVAVVFYNNSATDISAACSGTGCTGTNGGWVHPASCKASQASNYTVDVAYTLSAISATSVVISFSGAGGGFVDAFILEYSGATGTAAFDGCALGSTTTSATAQNGGTLTTTGANDLAIAAFTSSVDFTLTPTVSPAPWTSTPVYTNGPELIAEAKNFTARTTTPIATNSSAITSQAVTFAFKDAATTSFKPRLFTPIIISSLLWPELIQ